MVEVVLHARKNEQSEWLEIERLPDRLFGRREELREPGPESVRVASLALPNNEYAPTQATERSNRFGVAIYVAGQFRVPISPV